MPHKPPSFSALSALRAQILSGRYVCQSCTPKRYKSEPSQLSRARGIQVDRQSRFLQRRYSNIKATTSIGAQKSIPAVLQELHSRLNDLLSCASTYANLDQLQLVVRSLEPEDPITRIAVWGSGAQDERERFVRVLLADPLEERAEWEDLIGTAEQSPLLLRHDEYISYDAQSSPVRTLSIPSNFLLRHKLEILICASRGNPLEPTIEAGDGHSTRVVTIGYPVHGSIKYGSLSSGLLDAALSADKYGTEELKRITRYAVDFPIPLDDQTRDASALHLVNLVQAEKAIGQLRASAENALQYEKAWLSSGMTELVEFMQTLTSQHGLPLRRSLRSLILVILSDIEKSISVDELRCREELVAVNASPAARDSLNVAIASWAEAGHTELRDELENVFEGKTWRKVAWWKLPWRVDDVEMVASDILNRAYLVDAEKGVMWLTGRIQEAGLVDPHEPPLKQPEGPKGLFFKEIPDLVLPGMEPPSISKYIVASPSYPWSQLIASSRSKLLAETVPSLQASAQSLLLQALSTSSLFAALSSLIYVSTLTTSVFEAGALAAVGIIWSLRRLQKRWEHEKSDWVHFIKMEGKNTLAAIEKVCRDVVKQGNRRNEDPVGVEERVKAREVVQEVKQALGRLEQ